MTYINNEGLFGSEIEIRTGLRPVPFFLTLVGIFGIVVATFFCLNGMSATATADNDTKPTWQVISGVVKDVEMWREDDDCTSVIIKFEDGRWLKTWSHYKQCYMLYVGDYNEVTTDADNGQILWIKKKTGIVD